MRERPILFNGPLVRAILDGRKSQTRRPIKPQPPWWAEQVHQWARDGARWRGKIADALWDMRCPYGQPGDHLWVRETWADTSFDWEWGTKQEAVYRATDTEYGGPWRPSIHMPRWASRITLEVTDVRVERVQEIWTDHKGSSDPWCDIFAEGIPQEAVWDGTGAMPTPLSLFIQLWNSIYAKRGLGWDANPWVFAVSFRRIRP